MNAMKDVHTTLIVNTVFVNAIMDTSKDGEDVKVSGDKTRGQGSRNTGHNPLILSKRAIQLQTA